MKKLIVTIVTTLILLTSNNVYTCNNTNDLKFIGYSSRIRSELYTDSIGATLVINDNYNVYELFISELGDWSIECNSKKELMEYYKTYKENRNKLGIVKIRKYKNTYKVYFPFLKNKPYKVNNKNDLNMLLATYRENKRAIK